MIGRVLLIPAIAILASSCGDRKQTNRFADPILVKIAEYQDRRLTDSLRFFLKSGQANYRSAAVLAFASVQDTSVAGALGSILLEDPDPAVRSRAAFALGQTGGIAAVNALIPAINDTDARVARYALEALGKTIGMGDSGVLTDFQAMDSLRQEGLAWAYYRMAIRKVIVDEIIRHQAEFLSPSYSFSTRFAAAQFFDRVTATISSFSEKVVNAALNDPAPEVRMAAAGALRKLNTKSLLSTVSRILATEKDFRVRVNAIKAMRLLSYESAREVLLTGLSDADEQVKVAASEVLLSMGGNASLLEKTRDERNERIQANLYGSIIKAGGYTGGLEQEIKTMYQASTNSYQKAHLLSALSNVTSSSGFLFAQLIGSKEFVVKTAAAQGLADMHEHKDFSAKNQAEFVEYSKKAIADGDPGVISIIAGVLADSTLNYRRLIRDVTFLKEAREKLRLPKDIEAVQPLDEAIAVLEGRKKPEVPKNQFSHPINWTLVKSTPPNQGVTIKTSRGEIRIRLLVEEAPGSVANFIELVQKRYFDGRFVHRVVPNFVLQTGCNRGDGYGSEDFAIRSEFSMRQYVTGSVGYASAGKDTEGTQWFITHSRTPHLEGRYTIFAEVDRGMDIANAVGVGDVIESVTLAD